SRDAWSALAGADVVLAADPEDSQVIALLDDGIAVQPLDVDTPQERARALVTAAAGEEIVWVGSVDGDPGLSDAVAGEVSRLEDAPEVEVLVGSWDTPGGRLLDAVA